MDEEITETNAIEKENPVLESALLDVAARYLKTRNGWESNNISSDVTSFYFKQFPEFTIDSKDSTDPQYYDGEWVRGEIISYNEQDSFANYRNVKHNQIVLKKIQVVTFDGGKKQIVAPNWESFNRGRFYYYLEDSIEYAFQCYLTLQNGGKDDSKGLKYRKSANGLNTFDIPLLRDPSDLEEFIKFARDESKISPEREKNRQNAIFYEALAAYSNYVKK